VSGKPVILRERASLDVEEAVAHYRRTADEKVVIGLIDALERAFSHIARHPASGSPQYAHELGLPELRTWPLRRYPYLAFYVERDDHIDVWHVLHAVRDVPPSLSEKRILTRFPLALKVT
jgi:toxin ParE1/3/4